MATDNTPQERPDRGFGPGYLAGPYVLDLKLGEGGMAEVWRGKQLDTDELVAIKVLLRNLAGDEQIRSRFQREGQIRIDHPNVVQIKDFIEIEDRPAIVMAFYSGGSLENRIRPSGFTAQPLPMADVWRVSNQVLSALDYTHTEKHVVHRDVKPANILFDPAGNAHLADFGIALDMKRYDKTRVGGELGTFVYMSPEQIVRPGRVTHLADVYSFGVVLYEMLTARAPFESDPSDSDSYASYRVKEGHLKLPPPRPRRYNPTIPRLLEAIVLWSLVKPEGARLPGCKTFMKCLDTARTGSLWARLVLYVQILRTLANAGSEQAARRFRGLIYAAASVVLLIGLLVTASVASGIWHSDKISGQTKRDTAAENEIKARQQKRAEDQERARRQAEELVERQRQQEAQTAKDRDAELAKQQETQRETDAAAALAREKQLADEQAASRKQAQQERESRAELDRAQKALAAQQAQLQQAQQQQAEKQAAMEAAERARALQAAQEADRARADLAARDQQHQRELQHEREFQHPRSNAPELGSSTAGNPAVYVGPKSGTLVWTGDVHGSDLITIDKDHADSGSLTGSLPGVVVMLQPADSRHVAVAVPPGPQNNYQRLILRVSGNGTVRVTLKWVTPF